MKTITVSPGTAVFHIISCLQISSEDFREFLLTLEGCDDSATSDVAEQYVNSISKQIRELELTMQEAARFLNKQGIVRVEVTNSGVLA
jgi:hypothetical protein